MCFKLFQKKNISESESEDFISPLGESKINLLQHEW